MTTSKRFGKVVKEIQMSGTGYSHFLTLITTKENEHFSRYERLKFYKGSIKKLSAAVAEWSDGDSIALHIVYGLDYFCTYDEGKNAGRNSAFCNLNMSFIDNYYFTDEGRKKLNASFGKNNLINLTENIANNIDHIILAKSFIGEKNISIHKWNYPVDKKLSDHMGICVTIE